MNRGVGLTWCDPPNEATWGAHRRCPRPQAMASCSNRARKSAGSAFAFVGDAAGSFRFTSCCHPLLADRGPPSGAVKPNTVVSGRSPPVLGMAFGSGVLELLHSSALTPMRTTFGVLGKTELPRALGGKCRELLDNVIPLNESHLRRFWREYLPYYPSNRAHIGLNKNTPDERNVASRSFTIPNRVRIAAACLHHRYRWAEAA